MKIKHGYERHHTETKTEIETERETKRETNRHICRHTHTHRVSYNNTTYHFTHFSTNCIQILYNKRKKAHETHAL